MQKSVAVIAGMALAVSMFGYGQMAQAQTTTTVVTTTATVAPFTRDLTIGSTGADVLALQTWLMAHGYAIPSGPTTYFGTQTRAAVAAYQTAHGIQPTAGYFGPITRTSINAMLATSGTTVPGCTPGATYSSTTGQPCSGTSTSTVPGCLPGFAYSPTTGQSCSSGGGTSSGGALEGGEASLTNYNLLSEDSSGAEGENDVELATAEFDVDDADVSIERAELTLEFTGSGSANDRPWDYFDTIMVSADGDELASVDADNRNDWDEDGDRYTITLTDLDYIVREGDTAELTFMADIADNLDSDDINDGSFDIYVDDSGIRARDAAGIQQYTGDEDETVSFDFDEEENGDLSIRESSDNPDDGVFVIDDNDTSDDTDVLVGEIRNSGDVDSLITDMSFDSDTDITADFSDAVRRATLDIDGDTYRGDVNDDGTIDFDDLDVVVDADDTVEFTLSVQLASASISGVDEGDTISFDLDGDNISAEGEDSGDETDVDGSISGSTFTLSTTGLDVGDASNSSRVTTLSNVSSSYGTYTVRFRVTADDDDIFIPDNADDTGSASVGVLYDADAADDFAGTETAVLTSTADKGGSGNDYFVVRAGDSETFTLSVVLDPSSAGTYGVDMDALRYNTTGTTGMTLISFSTSGDSDFQTDPQYIPN